MQYFVTGATGFIGKRLVKKLLARKGSAARGRRLLAASAKNDLQCLKCHTVRGTGGQVGPDLSAIGKNLSDERILSAGFSDTRFLGTSEGVLSRGREWAVTIKRSF